MQNRSLSELPVIFADDPPLDPGSGSPGAVSELMIYDVTYLHFHRYLELGLCAGGDGVCCVEEQEYPFRAGDVQIIFPFQKHLSRNSGPVPSTWYWITLDALDILRRAGFENIDRVNEWMQREMGICGIVDPVRYPEICRCVRRIVDDFCGAAPEHVHREEQAAVRLMELVLGLCDASLPLPKLRLKTENSIACLAPAFRQLRLALDADQAPRVEEMGRACGMSPANFRRVFEREMGVCPKEHIAACCIHKAKKLLACTDMGIIDIAAAVGYQNISGFNRCFLARTGATPSGFRRSIRQGGGLPSESRSVPEYHEKDDET